MPAQPTREALDALRGRLIVSCQPVRGGPLDRPDIVAAMAQAALDGGAAGLRIEGLADLAAVRRTTQAPVIGLIKRSEPDRDTYITPLVSDVAALAEAGADIVAFDATDRRRATPVAALIAACRTAQVGAMADIADVVEAEAALASGCDVVGTTLGYVGDNTPDTDPNLVPDFSLLAACAAHARSRPAALLIAEGRIRTPAQAAAAMAAGAHAVVVGSAITRPEHITSWFAAVMEAAR